MNLSKMAFQSKGLRTVGNCYSNRLLENNSSRDLKLLETTIQIDFPNEGFQSQTTEKLSFE